MNAPVTITDPAQGRHLLDEFRKGYHRDMDGFRKKEAVFSANKRDKLYEHLRDAYSLAVTLKANDEVMLALLAQHGLKRDTRKGSNPWVEPVNLLFGRWEGSKFVTDRSAWKYAGTFRYMFENDIKPSDFVHYLQGHTLIETQKLDRFKHENQDPDVRSRRETLNEFVKQSGHSVIPKGSVLPPDGKERNMVALWGFVQGDRVYVLGELPGKAAMVETHAFRMAQRVKEYIDKLKKRREKPSKGKDPYWPKGLSREVWQPVVDAALSEGKPEAAKTIEVPMPKKRRIKKEEPVAA